MNASTRYMASHEWLTCIVVRPNRTAIYPKQASCVAELKWAAKRWASWRASKPSRLPRKPRSTTSNKQDDRSALFQPIADVPGKEIRNHIRQQKSPIAFVMNHLTNPRVLAAVLSEEPFLSGLNEIEWNVVRERARTTLHPVQADMQAKLTKALGELREGVKATQRLLLERCEIRADDDGQFRSIREPLPRGRLTAVPKASC